MAAICEVLLIGPQRLREILDFFSPSEAENAMNAVYQLREPCAIVLNDDTYALPPRR